MYRIQLLNSRDKEALMEQIASLPEANNASRTHMHIIHFPDGWPISLVNQNDYHNGLSRTMRQYRFNLESYSFYN